MVSKTESKRPKRARRSFTAELKAGAVSWSWMARAASASGWPFSVEVRALRAAIARML
jgi:hypothetical protein